MVLDEASPLVVVELAGNGVPLADLRAANALAGDVAAVSGAASDGRPEVEGFEFLHEIHRGGQGVLWLALRALLLYRFLGRLRVPAGR